MIHPNVFFGIIFGVLPLIFLILHLSDKFEAKQTIGFDKLEEIRLQRLERNRLKMRRP